MFTELLTPYMGESLAGLVAIIIWVALALIAIMIVWKMYIAVAGSGINLLGGKSRDVRLAIIDAAPVDQKRRIVLVRRDGVEHLLMIGGPNDIVIEQGIAGPQSVQNAIQQQSNLSQPAPAPASAPANNTSEATTQPKAPQAAKPAPKANLVKSALIPATATAAAAPNSQPSSQPNNQLDNFGDDITLDDDNLFDDLIAENLAAAKKPKAQRETPSADAVKAAPKPATTPRAEPAPSPTIETKPDMTAKAAENDISLEDEMQALIRDLKAK